MHHALLALGKDATLDFDSEVAHLQEMTRGFVQVIYSGLTEYTGEFSLWVSIICETEALCLLPDSTISPSSDCTCVGWNLGSIGYEFIQVRYKAKTESSGSIVKVLAIGKK